MNPPLNIQLIKLRRENGHTQQQAADLVHVCRRTWLAWETKQNRVHLGLWELYQMKTGALKLDGIRGANARQL